MRFMVIIKATPESEAGAMPDEQVLTAMGQYNEDLVNAGIMISGEGLHPSSNGARVTLSSSEPVVTDGPFTETKELVAGFWIWETASMEEAIEWAKRCPISEDEVAEIEIRKVFTAEDFGEEFTPELREAEDRLRERLEAQQGS